MKIKVTKEFRDKENKEELVPVKTEMIVSADRGKTIIEAGHAEDITPKKAAPKKKEAPKAEEKKEDKK